MSRYKMFFQTTEGKLEWINNDYASDADAIAKAKSVLKPGETVKVYAEVAGELQGRTVWDSEAQANIESFEYNDHQITIIERPFGITQPVAAGRNASFAGEFMTILYGQLHVACDIAAKAREFAPESWQPQAEEIFDKLCDLLILVDQTRP